MNNAASPPTDLEIYRATTEHRRPARILYSFSMTEDLQRRVTEHIGTKDYRRHYGLMNTVSVGPSRPAHIPPLDYSAYWKNQQLPPGTKIDGNGVAMAPSGLYHFWGYISPLRNAKTLSELEQYPMADIGRWDYSGMPPAVKAAHAEGKIVIGMVGHMYETAWQIRGYEEFLMDMMTQPAWAECLLERIAQNNMIIATAAARAGADELLCGDDVANQQALMFPPELWRRMMLSRWSKIWAEVKRINPAMRLWYHSDGNITAIVDELVKAGLDVLNPVQPECMDTDALYKKFGRRLTFHGLIGTQSTMPFGTPKSVRARVKEVIEKYGRNGGLILAPTHVLEPDVPIANIDAYCDACREFGT